MLDTPFEPSAASWNLISYLGGIGRRHLREHVGRRGRGIGGREHRGVPRREHRGIVGGERRGLGGELSRGQ